VVFPKKHPEQTDGRLLVPEDFVVQRDSEKMARRKEHPFADEFTPPFARVKKHGADLPPSL